MPASSSPSTESSPPFAGKVGIKLVSAGAYVSVGSPLVPLTTIDPIEIEFNVPEVYLDGLRPGLLVSATTSALPARVFQGQLLTVSPTVDRATRSVRLLARIPNAPGESDTSGPLKPGMFMSVSLTTSTRPNAVVVPEQALFFQGATTALLVVEPDSATVARREVTVGQRLPGLAEITSGLAAGELIVVEGTQKARPGQVVEPILDDTLRDRLAASAHVADRLSQPPNSATP